MSRLTHGTRHHIKKPWAFCAHGGFTQLSLSVVHIFPERIPPTGAQKSGTGASSQPETVRGIYSARSIFNLSRFRFPSADYDKYFCHTSCECDSPSMTIATNLGRDGGLSSFICASSGVRFPFRRLHGPQAATTFSQWVVPPRERGIMWSTVSSVLPGCPPQYWHVYISLAKTVRRESGSGKRRGIGTYVTNRITSGKSSAILSARIFA